MAAKNPFTATLGAMPPLLVGRENPIADFEDALDTGPGAHERVSIITGSRGSGKTVMLDRLAQSAATRGWLIYNETATPGFTDRLKNKIVRELQTEEALHGKKYLTGLGIQFFSLGLNLTWNTTPNTHKNYNLRDALTDLLRLKAAQNEQFNQEPAGVLITLDELHHSQNNEIIDLGVTTQHLIRERLEISVLMAGIPSAIKPLLAAGGGDNPVTFLRRANKIELGAIKIADVERALSKPLTEIGYQWEEAALKLAAKESGGYPFMIQLLGFEAFKLTKTSTITLKTAELAARNAKRKLGKLVHAPALDDLSAIDKNFLLCMAQDNGASKISDIAKRLKQSPQYTNNYRKRLLEAEMIVETGKGEIDFALPHLREYLREHETNNFYY